MNDPYSDRNRLIDGMEHERYTYFTLRDGNVGIHEREPLAALHVTRHFSEQNGADDLEHPKELAIFKVTYAGDGQGGHVPETTADSYARRLSVVSRNNYRAPALQGYGMTEGLGFFPQQICVQPEAQGVGENSKCHFGDWADVPDPYRFQFTGSVRVVSGIQVEAMTVTAGSGGVVGSIPGGAARVLVSSDDENKVISVPAASIGHIIRIYTGHTGCELRSVMELDQANGLAIGTTHELKLEAESHYSCECVAQNRWVVRGFTSSGADMPPLVPHLR